MVSMGAWEVATGVVVVVVVDTAGASVVAVVTVTVVLGFAALGAGASALGSASDEGVVAGPRGAMALGIGVVSTTPWLVPWGVLTESS